VVLEILHIKEGLLSIANISWSFSAYYGNKFFTTELNEQVYLVDLSSLFGISGSHHSRYEDDSSLGCSAVVCLHETTWQHIPENCHLLRFTALLYVVLTSLFCMST
jgi:hypothetical protein